MGQVLKDHCYSRKRRDSKDNQADVDVCPEKYAKKNGDCTSGSTDCKDKSEEVNTFV